MKEDKKLMNNRNTNIDEIFQMIVESAANNDKIVISTEKDRKAVNEIFNSMTLKERYYIDGDIGKKYIPTQYATKRRYETNKAGLLYHATVFVNDVPVSFLDIYDHMNSNGEIGEICIGTRGEKKYRGKGYASKVMNEGIKWFKKDKDMVSLRYYVHTENTPSIKFAIKNGFKIIDKNKDYVTLEIKK
jgi:GNAT superfamily N-acetyltransferase